VPEAWVDAVLPFVSMQVRAMIELQLFSGARPGEVCAMRTCDLDTSGRVWIYRPGFHKTEHLGRRREIYLGPRAQEVLNPWLRLDTQAYLFQPIEAEDHRRGERRKTIAVVNGGRTAGRRSIRRTSRRRRRNASAGREGCRATATK
jgi:integrase